MLGSENNPQPLAVVCAWCGAFSIAQVHGSVKVDPDDEDDPFAASYWHYLASCEKCGYPSLLGELALPGRQGPPDTLWPERRSALNAAIPEGLRRELEEARKCFDTRAYTAAVVMVRRSLEGFCLHQGSDERVLHRQLSDLAAKGKIDARLLEWANGLRWLGNQGAHYSGTQIAAQDAQDALDLAEAMFDYVYVFTVKFSEFRARQGKAEAL